ncbi:MAG: hypothetical protein ACRC0L_05710 [Angustibacter sp.]
MRLNVFRDPHDPSDGMAEVRFEPDRLNESSESVYMSLLEDKGWATVWLAPADARRAARALLKHADRGAR